MKTSEIRQAFLDFFVSKDHTLVASSDLVPQDDPTLLFTTAGMVQFKRLYDGTVEVPHRRATSCQKCLRVKGKASDLENVGRTVRHMTFFEMLGNFSFGDYFKREAIRWGWEFCTDIVGLDPERIWVTIFEDDDEAGDFWKSEVGYPAERIVKMGRKDNFWGPAGETGACGPCSEMHFDRGPEFGEGTPATNDERFLEFYNLVFPQYDFCEENPTRPLKNRGIDTGLGLERLAMLVQGVDSIFQTDGLRPACEHLSQLVDRDYGEDPEVTAAINACVDHARCLTFAISEGIIPSNEGRGYVMRAIIRRAIRLCKTRLHFPQPVLYHLVDDFIDAMGDAYPQIRQGVEHTRDVIRHEEERFLRTIDKGEKRFSALIAGLPKGSLIAGAPAFELYDTFGYPIEMTVEVAKDAGLEVDIRAFNNYLKEQKRKARAAWKGAELAESEKVFNSVAEEHGGTEFTGYESLVDQGDVVSLAFDGTLVDTLSEGQEGEVILTQSPFYAEQGGQVGDTGTLMHGESLFEVTDTQKTTHGLYRHIGRMARGSLAVGQVVKSEVNGDRRLAIRRHHSATHLLNAALREHLGSHVKQAGSLVSEHHLRFDFTHSSAVDAETLAAIEASVCEQIMADAPVETEVLPIEDARQRGAVAVFGEKYGEVVRVLTMGQGSVEFCGGTHLERTGQIGSFVITAESSIAAGTRRIEALAGEPAVRWLQTMRARQDRVSRALSIKPDELEDRLGAMHEEIKELRREIGELRQQASAAAVQSAGSEAVEVAGIRVIVQRLEVPGAGELRNAADVARAGKEKTAVVLGAEVKGKVALIAAVTEDLIKTLPAGKLVGAVAEFVGGKGGGRPDMAQAGGKDVAQLDEALAQVPGIVERLMG
jgi:alanyl-tRNA synthetase